MASFFSLSIVSSTQKFLSNLAFVIFFKTTENIVRLLFVLGVEDNLFAPASVLASRWFLLRFRFVFFGRSARYRFFIKERLGKFTYVFDSSDSAEK